MKLFRFALRSLSDSVSHRFHQPHTVRTLSTNALSESVMDDDKQKSNSFESTDDFESRIFGENSVGNSKTDAFFAKIEKLTKTHDGFSSNLAGRSRSGFHALEGLDESFSTLSDGMDGKLKRAATDFQFDSEEVQTDGYNFRPDISFQKGGTYELKDLDLTKPGVRKPIKRVEFETTTEEVLRKADFRNVRFLANFITEAGVINKRSKFKISAKAQRRVAREIKTARAFGLMPFTSMGTKSFAFGKTMENRDEDFQYESYDNPADDDERNPLGY